MSFCTKAITANSVGCNTLVGGIKEIKITPVGGTAVTLDTIPEQSHLESVYAYNPQNRSGVWTTNVFIKIGEINTTNRSTVESMAFNNVILEVTCETGHKVTVGSATRPAYMSAGNLLTGTAMEDANGIDATFTQKDTTSPSVTNPGA